MWGEVKCEGTDVTEVTGGEDEGGAWLGVMGRWAFFCFRVLVS